MGFTEGGRFMFEKDVWLFADAADMIGLGSKADVSRRGKDAEQELSSALLMAFTMDRRGELFHSGCTIVGGFVPRMETSTLCSRSLRRFLVRWF